MVQIDGLRTIAVFLVMFGHWTSIWPTFEKLDRFTSFFGVNLFFVLSGFLISAILIRTKSKSVESNSFILKQFYLRRFLRIFPLYYLVILAGVLLKIPAAKGDFFWLVTYLANFKAILTDGRLGYYAHLWSLSVEEQFYIFFPIIFLLTPIKHLNKLSVSLIILGLLSRLLPYLYSSNTLSAHLNWFELGFTSCCLDSFGFGILLANMFVNNQTLLIRILNNNRLLFMIPLLLSAISFSFTDLNSFTSIVLFRFLASITCFWIIGKAAVGTFKGIVGNILMNKTMAFLGRISYGLYVYHFFMPYVYSNYHRIYSTDIKSVIFTRLIFLVTTILISIISFYLFENPINSLKKYFNYR